MKRIFSEKIVKIRKTDNSYSNGKGEMIQIEYNEKDMNSSPEKEFITGICFNKDGDVVLRAESTNLKEPYYIITGNKDDKKALNMIIDVINEKEILYTNFNPYIYGKGKMIFFNPSDDNEAILGIGIESSNKYVIQKIDNNVSKYNNKIIYETF